MTSDEAYQEAWEENRMWLGQDDELFKSGWNAALEWVKSGQSPVAWMYEHSGKMRVTFTDQRPIDEAHPNIPKSVSLYTHPAPAQPAVVQQLVEMLKYATTHYTDDNDQWLSQARDFLASFKGE